ncbi:MAG: hypothetical protein HC936_07715 [Leptolyngbyaceae cyanobacterium SU_3_3]|nr:hypothetical protein [Leptolyngbyaceae cyanobacterium SU_3_3]
MAKALWWLGSVIALGSLLLSLDGRSSLAASPASASQTLADRRLHIAQTLVHYLPNSAEGYNQLASAYLLKSRETGDFSNIVKAESALDQSLHLEPDNQFDNQFGNQSGNGEALKLQLILLLTEHRFRGGG